MSFNYNEIGNRWTAIWNEADETTRQSQLAQIWTLDAKHFAPGFAATGLEAILERVNAVHERFIQQAGCNIHCVDCAGHGDVLRVLWAIVPARGGPALMTGSEVLMLNEAGAVRLDYQFNDPAR
jgi:hypothetical protein